MRHLIVMLLLVATLLLPACRRATSPKDITATARQLALDTRMPDPIDDAARFGYAQRSSHAHADARGPAPIRWETPGGWTEEAAVRPRLGSFRVGPEGEADCSLVALAGAGGGLLANVNRWRGQMQLPETTEDALAKLPTCKIFGVDGVLVELAGRYAGMGSETTVDDALMLAVVLAFGDKTIFVKLVGPASIVEAERERFLAFCASLHVHTGEHDHAHAAAEPEGSSTAPVAAAAEPVFNWTLPAGWRVAPPRPMRDANFVVGDNEDIQCYISVLTGAGGGDKANITRWRDQMGQAPLSSGEIAALPTLEVLGRKAKLVEITGTFTGMNGGVQADAMLLGVLCPLDGRTAFFKMIGPAAAVTAEKANFIAFCQSVEP